MSSRLLTLLDDQRLTTPVTFTPTSGALSVTIGLAVKAGTAAVIDWGDGTTTTVANNGAYQNYTHTYASAGTYLGALRDSGVVMVLRMVSETKVSLSITGMALTSLFLSGTGPAVTGVITGMALTSLTLSGTGTAVTGVITGMALTSLALYGTGPAVTGVITGMALTSLILSGTVTGVTGVITGMALTSLILSGTGTEVTGVITGMALTSLSISGTGTGVTGVITGMALTSLTLSGTGTAVTGVLAITARLRREYLDITSVITLPTTRIYGTWGAESMRIKMGVKLTAAEVDATFNALNAAPRSGVTSIYIYGAAPTAASLDARTNLSSLGFGITITG